MRFKRFLAVMAVVAFVANLAAVAWAIPYASSVRNTTGTTWEFVLNESADNVTVLRDGNPLDLGALAPGRHTFSMAGFSAFEIQVSKSAAAGWTSIHGAGNPFTNFTLPTGVAINTNASDLAYFGTVYVGHGNTTTSQRGRLMGDGVYALTADMVGVDLANNFAVVTDPNDTTQAKAPNWTVAGSGNSPWRLSLDEAGNLIVADWSDANGGIKWASKDLTTGGPLLMFEDGVRPLLINNENEEVHGSIAAKVYTTGSVGNNLVVYAVDEDYDLDGETLNNATSGNHIWRWDVGNLANTDPNGGYDQPPSALVINMSNIPRTSDNRSNMLNLNIGVAIGAHYSPRYNKWYLTEPRDGSSGGSDQGAIAIVTPDGVDGNSPILEWSSLQWSIDNNLDGNPTIGDVDQPAGGCDVNVSPTCAIQDMFRRVRDLSVSPDGKWLVGNRSVYTPALNGLGDGALVLIPLDENGIPDIQVVDGQITNVITIQMVGNTLGHTTGAQVEWDLAGNLYALNSGVVTGNPDATAQLLQVFSPGGAWTAITRSNGTFELVPIAGLTGDENGDGKVDAADYVLLRKRNASAAEFDAWRANFGATSGSGSALGAAVPEPTTFALVALGLLVVGARSRRAN